MSNPRRGLPLRQLIAYAAPGIPLAALTLPVYIFLPTFYAEDMGLSLAAIGWILVLVRVFDAFSDPIIGFLSDRLRTRWGRRRPWILLSTPLTLAAVVALFMPGASVGLTYFALWSLILSIGWTMLLLPYNAWGAELSPDYNERSRISGIREAFVVVGTLLATSMPFVIQSSGLGEEGLRTSLSFLAILLLGLLPATVAYACFSVPEPPTSGIRTVSLANGSRVLWKNKPFRRLLTAFLFNGIANGLPASLIILFVTHRLEEPDKFGLVLIVYFLCGVLSVPLWLRVARRYNKHNAWIAAMLVACFGFIWTPLLGPGDFWIFMLITVVTGLTLGADLALPASMQADVVDIDTLESGEQRTGLYFALWGLATKLALALAAGIAFPILDISGFDATRSDNDDGALLTLALLYSLLPVFLKLAAIVLMRGFPITPDSQREVRAAIEARLTP